MTVDQIATVGCIVILGALVGTAVQLMGRWRRARREFVEHIRREEGRRVRW